MSKYTKSEKKQILLIVMCVLVYTVSYISRRSYTRNKTEIAALFGVLDTDTGLVATFYSIAYAIGQVVHGLLCKRYNKKVVIPFVLAVSAAINLILFFEPPFVFYKYLWFLNGIALSVLWPSLINILSTTLDEKFLDLSVTLMAMPVALGTCLAYGSSALFKLIGDYRYSFIFGAVAPLIMVFVWFFSFDSLTKNARLKASAMQEKASAAVSQTSKTSTENAAKKAVSVSILLLFITIGIFAVANNLIKDGTEEWFSNILEEKYGLPASLSTVLAIVLPIFGMAGAVFSVFMNRYIKDFVLLDGLFYLITALFLLLIIFALMFNWSVVFVVLFFGIISLLAHSINCLNTSVAPLKMRESFNSGFIAGVFNSCSYVGSAISGGGLGAISVASGWLAVLWLLLGVSVFCILLVLIHTLANFIKIKILIKK